MENYKDLSGQSGITFYEIGDDYIAVKFKNKHHTYVYRNSKAGKPHIDKMKKLAVDGQGLSSYITQHPDVKNNFSKK